MHCRVHIVVYTEKVQIDIVDFVEPYLIVWNHVVHDDPDARVPQGVLMFM